MVAGRTRGAQLILIAIGMTGLEVRGHACAGGRPNEPQTENRGSQQGSRSGNHQAWPLGHLPHPVARRVLTDALEAASTRLKSDKCREILTDFGNLTERALTDRLASLGTSIEPYLAMVVFVDDSRHRLCLAGSLLFTAPGSRVVRVCGEELRRRSLSSDYVVAVVIHEILHTLGLQENPPSSTEITRRVLARCGTTK